MVTTLPLSPVSFQPASRRRTPLAGPLFWQCRHEEGWWYIAASRAPGDPPIFLLPLSQWHQSEAKAREICEALGRIYS
jgi:hypothetical protein